MAEAGGNFMKSELKLIIEIDRLPAADLAKMLRALDRSFNSFVNRANGRTLNARLAVSAVRRGSIEVVLEAIAAYEKLMLAQQSLAPFASHLAQLAGLALAGSKPEVDANATDVDLKAIKSLIGPVASGNAVQVDLVFNGNPILTVGTPEEAWAITNGLTALQGAKDSGLAEATMEAPQLPKESRVTTEQIANLERGSLQGTAFMAGGSWYARLVGGHGVLVPMTASKETLAHLQDGKMYAFRGKPTFGSKGETVGITVEQAMAVGSIVKYRGL
ncbi:MAG: hypothetical protein ABJF67_14170 [Aurantimonas coralicida]|uniref:hypothetical protein n=1 Tax=Nisaea sp. TaxID=2024842 RepID=UPI003266A71A